MKTKYTYCYYVGGTDRGKWVRVFDTYSSLADCRKYAVKTEKMGYPTRSYAIANLDAIGMPIGPPSEILNGTFPV